MKSTIPNLIAVAALLFSWTVQAADVVAPKAQPPATQSVAETTAVPPTAAPESTPLATPEKPAASMKHSKRNKRAKANDLHSKSLDLRYCLDLKTNAEIATCAGE
jgi:hypothetical protein